MDVLYASEHTEQRQEDARGVLSRGVPSTALWLGGEAPLPPQLCLTPDGDQGFDSKTQLSWDSFPSQTAEL